MIVLIGSNKGGSGKTTVACNLAVALARSGKRVCLVDADLQASASNWSQEREHNDLKPYINVTQKYNNISNTIKDFGKLYDEVIIDVAGRNSREMITAAMVADVILCPSQCSQLDLDTLSELESQMVTIRDYNPDIKVYIYQTMASTNAKVIESERTDFENFVADFEGFIALKAIGRYRKVYKDVFESGLSVLETDNSVAASEVLALQSEVYQNGQN